MNNLVCTQCANFVGIDENENLICSKNGGPAKCKKFLTAQETAGARQPVMEQQMIVVRQLPIIEQHLRGLSAEIDQAVDEALSLVCNEDTVKTVKKVRADMNSRAKALEDQRKEVKAAIMAPYLDFETVFKECVTDKLKAADALLKQKVDDTENGVKDQKREELRRYFNELAAARHLEFLTLEDAGLNITLSATQTGLKKNATAFIDRVETDVEMITAHSESDEIMAEYKSNGYQVSRAISTVMERKAAIARQKDEAERRAELRRQESEAVKRTMDGIQPVAAPVAAPIAAPVAPAAPASTQKSPDDILTVVFCVQDTRARMIVLRDWLSANGYRYE